jgi:hypothetical protein
MKNNNKANEVLEIIQALQDKIAKQGRITNARDEEHLKNLIVYYNELNESEVIND